MAVFILLKFAITNIRSLLGIFNIVSHWFVEIFPKISQKLTLELGSQILDVLGEFEKYVLPQSLIEHDELQTRYFLKRHVA